MRARTLASASTKVSRALLQQVVQRRCTAATIRCAKTENRKQCSEGCAACEPAVSLCFIAKSCKGFGGAEGKEKGARFAAKATERLSRYLSRAKGRVRARTGFPF